MGEQKTKKISEEEVLKQAEETLKALEVKKQADSKDTSGEIKEKKSGKSKLKPIKKKIRSAKYQEKLKLVDRNKFYNVDDALSLVKKTSYSKFPASVEVHVRLANDKKNKLVLRGLVQMPYPTGKVAKVGILDEVLIEKIFKEKKTEFKILLARPEMMSKMAKIAKILGPKGLMPNPKSGTITADPQKTLEEINNGRIEYKIDVSDVVHLVIGKVADDSKHLLANYQALMAVMPKADLRMVTFSATMGPGIKVEI